ncbi:hypothetical protein [Pseudonocardia pini]|uniref:hypothetical protein n=1 Tax=Pseudonocardia pini TaxID=2758030 RepID=UPI0015F049B8|nr:hypothetical protein [Pseudonocardia pini]
MAEASAAFANIDRDMEGYLATRRADMDVATPPLRAKGLRADALVAANEIARTSETLQADA